MAATYVTQQELRNNLGIQSLYENATVEECCQAAEDQINSFLWFDDVPVVGTSLTNGLATVMLANPGIFNVGQSVTVSGSGAAFNGTYTITGSIPFSGGVNNYLPYLAFTYNVYQYPNGFSFIQYAAPGHADRTFRRVLPYGKAQGVDTKTTVYASTASVREAAMILAVDIWQARQVSQSGGVSIDNFSPSPYRMGNSMIGKIRGLLAPYMSPASMIG